MWIRPRVVNSWPPCPFWEQGDWTENSALLSVIDLVIACKTMTYVMSLVWLAALSDSCLLSQQQSVPAPTDVVAGCPASWPRRRGREPFLRVLVVIPAGLKGLRNSASCVANSDGRICLSDRGRIIPLTDEPSEPERHIEVYAG